MHLPKPSPDIGLVYPKQSGGNTWRAVCMSFNMDPQELIQESADDLSRANITLFYKTIQKGMTSKQYFLQGFAPEADLDFWRDFFFAEINKLVRGSSVPDNLSCPFTHIALKRKMGVHIKFKRCYANTRVDTSILFLIQRHLQLCMVSKSNYILCITTRNHSLRKRKFVTVLLSTGSCYITWTRWTEM
eukprot:8138836-Ditylum_brightwellii.AAC.1